MTSQSSKPTLFRVVKNMGVTGGIQCRLLALLPALLPHFNVHLVAIKKTGPMMEELEKLGVRTHFIPIKRKWSPLGIHRLAKLFKEYKADIVHGHERGASIPTIVAGALAGVPVRIGMMHSRGSQWPAKGPLRQRFQIFTESLLHRFFTSEFLCVSEECRDYFLEQTRLPPNKASVLYNGIEFKAQPDSSTLEDIKQQYNVPKSSIIIGFVGRIASGKGIDFLISTAQKLAKENKNSSAPLSYTFFMVGPSFENFCEEMENSFANLTEHGVNLIFAGEQKNPNPFYYIFNLLFLPSPPKREGFPGVILEAAAAGLPILTRDIAATEELKKYYSRAYKMQDNDSPTEAIAKTLALPKVTDEEKESFKNTFSFEAMVRRTLDLYKTLLKEKEVPKPKANNTPYPDRA